MKIATWNLERPTPSSKTKNGKIIESLQSIDADILILTETNAIVNPGAAYMDYATISLDFWPEPYYKPGENRTTIWSKYAITEQVTTYDAFTAVCGVIQTPLGPITVYGTIIGIHANRRASFDIDLNKQLADWETLIGIGNTCIAGDFNISFADNYYYTKTGRNAISQFFKKHQLVNLTHDIPQNIDHIVISKALIEQADLQISTWNEDKKLSDHIGVCVSIQG
ncbi:hypothetical protein BH09BAC1_BH09BAC1_19370 [soil metagenome]